MFVTPGGEIGRHEGLKILFRKEYQFKSGLGDLREVSVRVNLARFYKKLLSRWEIWLWFSSLKLRLQTDLSLFE